MIQLGLNCKLYRNTGTYGSPTYNAIDCVRDLTLSLSKGEADVSTRGGGGWKATRGTLKDASLEFKMIPDRAVANDEADLDAIAASFYGTTPIELVVLDNSEPAPVGGVAPDGLRAYWEITGFVRNENLEEGVSWDVTAKVSVSGGQAPVQFTGTVAT